MPLTALGVKSARPKDKPHTLSDEKGLYLLVTPSGSKLWRFDCRFANRRKTLASGKWDDVELARARERRDAARECLAAGRDPGIGNAHEAAVKNSFEAVARDWHRPHYRTSRPRWNARMSPTIRPAKLNQIRTSPTRL